MDSTIRHMPDNHPIITAFLFAISVLYSAIAFFCDIIHVDFLKGHLLAIVDHAGTIDIIVKLCSLSISACVAFFMYIINEEKIRPRIKQLYQRIKKCGKP